MVMTLSANVNGIVIAANKNNQLAQVAYNDIYLDKYQNISVSTDLHALVEQCAQAAKTLLGELVLNTQVGIPYFENVWIGVPDIQQFNAALRNAFLSVVGVIDVIDLTVTKNDAKNVNVLLYSATINTIYGIGTVNG